MSRIVTTVFAGENGVVLWQPPLKPALGMGPVMFSVPPLRVITALPVMRVPHGRHGSEPVIVVNGSLMIVVQLGASGASM